MMGIHAGTMCGRERQVMDMAVSQSCNSKHDVCTTAVVEIYVSEHCFVCEYAYEVAAAIRRDFPAVAVRIIEIHNPQTVVPDVVFATPTYLLNGKVWSLGNPSPEAVTETLSALQP